MIFGKKEDLETFLEKYKDDPERIKRVISRIEWARPDRWFIREVTDGPAETDFIEKLKTQADMPKLTQVSADNPRRKIMTPVNTVPVTVNKTPPVKRPPNIFGKVKQLWEVTTGPEVVDSVREERLNKCNVTGGYTWSPVYGSVLSIDGNKINIAGTTIQLPDDEKPAVAVGDTVEIGQIIAVGEVAKPCQYRRTINDGIYCDACGCGSRSKAELNNKTKYARLVCPRIYPLFNKEDENGDRVKK